MLQRLAGLHDVSRQIGKLVSTMDWRQHRGQQVSNLLYLELPCSGGSHLASESWDSRPLRARRRTSEGRTENEWRGDGIESRTSPFIASAAITA
jgi:hypothetical protein